MIDVRKKITKSTWGNLMLILVAVLTFLITSMIQYRHTQSSIKESASKLAEEQLQTTKLEIEDVLDQAEVAVHNNIWISQWSLTHLDSIQTITRRMVQNNPVVMGSTIALVPGYNKEHPLLAPYTSMDPYTGELSSISLATPEYDYPSKKWFTMALNRESGCWSEPYVDIGGGEMLMTTFSMPIRDSNGEIAAVLTADVSLDWLTDMFGDVGGYPSAFSVMSSRTGKLMVCPVPSFVMQKNIQDILAPIEDTSAIHSLARELMTGGTGNMSINYEGKTHYVYYAPVERTGWAMSIVIPEDEIFSESRKTNKLVRLSQIIGLLMLFLILYFVARDQAKVKEMSEKEQRMASELSIASAIQMAMIPKVFPPFPERHDIDISALLDPAREVGGDLYDFYIRDEKLFFCIGDVSGKGVPASLVMAVTRSLFRSISSRENSPGLIVSMMNDSMFEANENNFFVTFFCGILDLSTGHLRFCNAGHNAPVLLADKKEMLQVIPNLPLGIIKEMTFEEQEIDLYDDDALFLYTDGLTEAENSVHELFGEKRMLSVLTSRRSAQEHLDIMKKNVYDFVKDAPQSDDLTMLLIHFTNDSLKRCSGYHMVLSNDIKEIPRLKGFVDYVFEGKKVGQDVVNGINLALEEIVSNVIMYAYPEGKIGLAAVDATIKDDSVIFTISDSGVPFDPTAAPEVDTTLGAEERGIGGLGIFMARNIMDSITYKREGDSNILTMTKKI